MQRFDVASEGEQGSVHASILPPPTDIRSALKIALIGCFICG